MHTAYDLHPNLFDLWLDGQPASLADIFPGWHRHDRFGIVVHEALGALGASLLIQLAVVAFYEAKPGRRGAPPRYPEIYLFHVGGRFGDFSAFDFWPPRKEVFLPSVESRVLEALNDYAITRLAVPDGAGRPGAFAYKEPEAAAERIASCFAYRADGRTEGADVELRAKDAILHKNVDATLDPAATLATAKAQIVSHPPPRMRDRTRWLEHLAARRDEVAAPTRAAMRDTCIARLPRETVRRISVAAALERLIA
jgi:hypothetical protein